MQTLKSHTVNGRRIRPAYIFPGGPIHGYIVTQGKILLVSCSADKHGAGGVEAAMEMAIRFAKNRPTSRDEGRAVTWRWGEDRNNRNYSSRPDWLAFCGRTAVVAHYSGSADSMVFHDKTGIPPRPMRRGIYR